MYTLHRILGKVTSVKRLADGAFIPAFATTNPDWLAFVVWNDAQQPPLSLEDTSPTQAELDAAQLVIDAAADKQNLKDGVAALLADIATGIAACDTDIADAQADATAANAAANLAAAKPPLVSCANNIERLATRLKRTLQGIEDIVKALRRLV
jgi:hypothetical protein